MMKRSTVGYLGRGIQLPTISEIASHVVCAQATISRAIVLNASLSAATPAAVNRRRRRRGGEATAAAASNVAMSSFRISSEDNRRARLPTTIQGPQRLRAATMSHYTVAIPSATPGAASRQPALRDP
jgi:hypothetical protein